MNKNKTKKSIKLQIRVSPLFKQYLKNTAKAHHSSMSHILKHRCLHHKDINYSVDIPQFNSVMNQINQIRLQAQGGFTNINQMAKKANQGQYEVALMNLSGIKTQINKLISEMDRIEDDLVVQYKNHN